VLRRRRVRGEHEERGEQERKGDRSGNIELNDRDDKYI
jgi:hypothetical protein